MGYLGSCGVMARPQRCKHASWLQPTSADLQVPLVVQQQRRCGGNSRQLLKRLSAEQQPSAASSKRASHHWSVMPTSFNPWSSAQPGHSPLGQPPRMPRAADERAALVACLEGVVQALGLRGDTPLPADAARTWSEYQLLKHFGQRIRRGMESAQVHAVDGHASSGSDHHGGDREGQVPVGSCFPQASADCTAKWLPSLTRLQPVGEPRVRVVCFHSAGCAEDMFSSEGTGTRRAPSPLLEWCRAHSAELLAVQAPGRGTRQKEAPCTSALDLAQQVLLVLGHRLQRPAAAVAAPATTAAASRVMGDTAGATAAAAAASKKGSSACEAVPWVIVSHSMGCWVAFELLRLARQTGLPMPAAWFISAMPAPDIPEEERPWNQQCHLDEESFMAECRAWDINEVVFAPGMWQTYQPLLRADFTVFDQYVYHPLTQAPQGAAAPACNQSEAGLPEESAAQPPFAFPIHTFWGSQDGRVTQAMVQEWWRFTSGPFSCTRIEGNHLWPLQKEAKAAWLSKVVEGLRKLFD